MNWLTSDHHFDHRNIIKYCARPFRDVSHMNNELVRLWNETVTSSDTVYYLGDFSLGIDPVINIAPMLNGRKILVAGNHDPIHPYQHKGKLKPELAETYTKAGFERIELQMRIQLEDGVWAELCHLPFIPPDPVYVRPRLEQYRPKPHKYLHLCGHVHGLWLMNGKHINVGVDVWDYKPVSFGQIIELAREHKII